MKTNRESIKKRRKEFRVEGDRIVILGHEKDRTKARPDPKKGFKKRVRK
jgi:hypothetical protein